MLTLTVNGLNSPIKRHHLTNWIKKEDPTICCLQENHLIDRNKQWLKVKGWKIYQANGPQKQAGVATLILHKADFKLTLIKCDKEGYSILIKGEIHQKEIMIINLYVPNVSAPNFIKHTLKDLKAYVNSNTVVVGVFNNPLSPIDRSSKQKFNKF
jgi:exonuclease III